MKLTKALVKSVQQDIDAYGLEIALHNLLWRQAAEQLKDIGSDRIRTEHPADRRSA